MRKPDRGVSAHRHKRLTRGAIALLAYGALGSAGAPGSRSEHMGAQDTAFINEVSFRRMANHAPKPAYPAASIQKKTSGVAVVSVLGGVDGRVETAVVLQAPDELIGSAVRGAVMQWTFTPNRLGGPDGPLMRTTSKLTFYFHIANGTGQVLNPDEMPGARRAPLPGQSGSKARAGDAPPVSKLDAGDPVPVLDGAELARLLASVGPIVLDIRDRDAFRHGHRDGAVNMPTDEIPVRAPIELAGAKSIVIDCSQGDEGWCRIAGQILRRQGFSKVAIFR